MAALGDESSIRGNSVTEPGFKPPWAFAKAAALNNVPEPWCLPLAGPSAWDRLLGDPAAAGWRENTGVGILAMPSSILTAAGDGGTRAQRGSSLARHHTASAHISAFSQSCPGRPPGTGGSVRLGSMLASLLPSPQPRSRRGRCGPGCAAGQAGWGRSPACRMQRGWAQAATRGGCIFPQHDKPPASSFPDRTGSEWATSQGRRAGRQAGQGRPERKSHGRSQA